MMYPAVFSIVIGVGMIGQWSASFATKQIPELNTEPFRIWFHIAGEMVTACMLIASGIGLLAAAAWAPTVFYISSGLLFYTVIVSPGYFAQKGNWIWVFAFGVILTLGIVAVLVVAGGT